MAGVHLEVGIGRDRPGTGVRHPGTRLVLGRSPDCEVSIDADMVSREHVEIALVDRGRWQVRDLDSANGTFLNRRRIAVADLRPGDVLRLGEGGPKVRVVALDAADDDEEVDLEATRYLRVKPREQPVAARTPEYAVRTKETPARQGGWPWLAVVGALLGAATGWGVWGDAFPYVVAGAPAFYLGVGLTRLVEPLASHPGWVLVVACALYWALAGWLAQRRGLRPLLILLAGAHVFAWIFLGLGAA